MPTVAETIAGAIGRLQPVTETPRLDAEILLAHAMNVSRAQLLARLRDAVPSATSRHLEELLARRLAHEPIAYVLGHWEFFSLDLITRAPILVPRPETEHLVEVALERLRACVASGGHTLPGHGPRLLDLCTGTGCVAVAVMKHFPQAEVTATDLNPNAVVLARENAARHETRVEFHEGDLFAALPADTAPFNLIVSNPPYVAVGEWEGLAGDIRLHEDPRALLGGEDGLDIVRRVVIEAPKWLVPGAVLALEVGESHFDEVFALMQAAGYVRIHFRRDLAGIKRIIYGECEGGTSLTGDSRAV